MEDIDARSIQAVPAIHIVPSRNIVFSYEASAQNIGGGGSVQGKVVDSNGAAVPNAKVEINNRVSGYHREIISGAEGTFTFHNLPENPYQISVTAAGFAPSKQVIDVKGSIPAQVNVNLSIAGASTTVEVKGEGEMLENDPTFHTDIDRGLFEKLPLESQSSSVSSLVTLASPGVVADSNGLFHGLGDHAENSFSVDGQPITDQQSKVFSNQIPVDSIQSLEVISGAPPAEYGGKTSLVINVTTRSGLGQKQPTGSIATSYGSFGTATAGADVAFGSDKWGNFVSASGLNTGRFLESAGIPSDPFERQRAKPLRPFRCPAVRQRHRTPESWLYPVLVPAAEFV